MFPRHAIIALGLAGVLGCTSFRTTALYRMENDSVTKELTNKNLKGIPVKLKIPSHVTVTIYEQQILLAEDPEVTKKLNDAVATATTNFKTAQAGFDTQNDTVNTIRTRLIDVNAILTKARANLNDPLLRDAANAQIAEYEPQAVLLKSSLVVEEKNLTASGKERDAKADALQVAKAKALTPKNALVSFTPAQLMVETELKYTDKVFLVDFKRPAGGVLNLNSADIDDEQYFSKIQADVTERTLADVSGAINTLKGPLGNLAKKNPNNATPTSAITPDGEVTNGVDFQKSVVAFRRFDLNEPDWELAMRGFVDSHLGQDPVLVSTLQIAAPTPAPVPAPVP